MTASGLPAVCINFAISSDLAWLLGVLFACALEEMAEMALSMEELRGRPVVGPLGAVDVVGLAMAEVGALLDEPSTGFGFTGWRTL